MNSTVSIKRIEANRRNALKSTGPQTVEGKLVSRRNALKHGLLAREVVIDCGDGRENGEEFEAFLAAYREHYQPLGLEEETMVEVMVVSQWRWARAIRCELGEIRSRLDDAQADYARKSQQNIRGMKHFIGIVDEAGKAFETSSAGIEYLLSIVEDVRSKVVADGDLSEELLKRIAQTFGAKSDFVFRCFESSAKTSKTARRKRSARNGNAAWEYSREDRTTLIAEACNREKERLQELRKAVLHKEALHIDARLKSLSLPGKDEMDRIMRYETTLERQYYRARDRLEIAQRLRKGEAVPPPITVHVAAGK